jgi:hypothetical protein
MVRVRQIQIWITLKKLMETRKIMTADVSEKLFAFIQRSQVKRKWATLDRFGHSQ